MYRLLVVKAFRPDRLIASAHLLVNAVFGPAFMQAGEKELDLANAVENEVRMLD